MGWSDYGFPDTRMMSCYKPAHALRIAQTERASFVTSSVDTYFTTNKSGTATAGKEFTQNLDGWKIPNGYINHLIDLDAPVDVLDDGYPRILFREEHEIKDIIEERDADGTGYIDANSQYLLMLNEWPSVWIKQRYLAFNLLKVISVPFVVTYREGHSVFVSGTPEQAFYEACKDTYTFTRVLSANMRLGLECYTKIGKYPYFYGHACHFLRIEKIEIDYSTAPWLAGLPAYLYIAARTNNITPDSVFDAHGFPVRDERRTFAKISLPWENYENTLPEHGLDVGAYGFQADYYMGTGGLYKMWQYAGVDVSSKFILYDNVDNP